jgi:hypothetical protein
VAWQSPAQCRPAVLTSALSAFLTDALDYDRVCDASLPLETILSPSPSLRALLQALDPTKVRLFALTNAYKTHARRVLSILGVEDLVEGLAYCDYGRPDGDFSCKPELGFYNEVRGAERSFGSPLSIADALPSPRRRSTTLVAGLGRTTLSTTRCSTFGPRSSSRLRGSPSTTRNGQTGMPTTVGLTSFGPTPTASPGGRSAVSMSSGRSGPSSFTRRHAR